MRCLTCGKELPEDGPRDGTDVQEDHTAYLGYGSTTADGDMRRFPGKAPGFHCYDCMDADVRDGKSEFVRAHMFLSHLRPEQRGGEPEAMRQAIRQAMEHYDQILRVLRTEPDIKNVRRFIESRLYRSIKFAEEALGEEYEPMFGEAEDDTLPWGREPKEGAESGT